MRTVAGLGARGRSKRLSGCYCQNHIKEKNVKYYELTKDQIKAIRILKGYDPDLRIKVKVTYDQIQSIISLIEDNVINLLGVDEVNEMMDLTDDQRDIVHNNLMLQVLIGTS